MLILCPLSITAIFIWVTLGHARGLDAGHPMEYLQITCILWGVVMTVLPVLRLIRIVSLPFWFTALLYGDMYMFVLTLCGGFYFDLFWWADFTHVVSTMVIASVVFMALCAVQAGSPSHTTLGSRGGIIAVMILVTFSFGAIWEIMEGFTGILTGVDYMSYGTMHTMGNITADMLGALIMAAAAWAMLGYRDAKDIASKIRLGRKRIDVGE